MMHRSSRARQRGISFLGLVFVGAVIAVVAAVGVQVAPTVLEYQTIVKAAKKSANEGSTVAEVRSSPPAARTVAPRLSAKRCGPPTGYQAPWV